LGYHDAVNVDVDVADDDDDGDNGGHLTLGVGCHHRELAGSGQSLSTTATLSHHTSGIEALMIIFDFCAYIS